MDGRTSRLSNLGFHRQTTFQLSGLSYLTAWAIHGTPVERSAVLVGLDRRRFPMQLDVRLFALGKEIGLLRSPHLRVLQRQPWPAQWCTHYAPRR